MEINVRKFKDEAVNYAGIVEKYDECLGNFYNELKDTSSYWIDNQSGEYYDNLSFEKNDVNELIENLKEIMSIYNFIYQNYEKIGEKISYNSEHKDDVIASFNKIIDELSVALKKYTNLNINTTEKNNILKQRNNIKSIKKNMQNLQSKVINKFDEIEQIERDVNKKLANINIKNIKETELGKYL